MYCNIAQYGAVQSSTWQNFPFIHPSAIWFLNYPISFFSPLLSYCPSSVQSCLTLIFLFFFTLSLSAPSLPNQPCLFYSLLIPSLLISFQPPSLPPSLPLLPSFFLCYHLSPPSPTFFLNFFFFSVDHSSSHYFFILPLLYFRRSLSGPC